MASNVILKLCAKKSSASLLNTRYYSQKKGFFASVIDNVKEEFSKNKEMSESIKQFREEAKKLEQSDALKEARKKYRALEDETGKSTQIIKDKLKSISENVKESDFTKKATETTGNIFKQAQDAAKTISKQTQDFSNTATMKNISSNVKAIKDEIDNVTQLAGARPYIAPEKLRKRTEGLASDDQKVYESNTDAQDITLHKDSKWYQSWNNFKDNNTYVNKLFDLKMKYDESDNALIRASRAVTEKFYDVFGNMFKSTEMSAVLTEITKSDPNFDVNEFIKFVQYDMIPNVLEAISRQELEILKDWCTEAAFTVLSHPITTCAQLKVKYNSIVLDVSNVDIAASRIMDQGPVLIITFNAQQIIYCSDSSNKVVEGDKDKIKRVLYVWALSRDQTILDPKAAWRLMECSQHHTDLFV